MSMHDAAPTTASNIEDDIDAAILREMEALSFEDEEDDDEVQMVAKDENENIPQDAQEEDEVDLPASMMEYITRMQEQSSQLQNELDECDDIMLHSSRVISARNSSSDLLTTLARQEGMEPDLLKRKVLEELEKEEEEESKWEPVTNQTLESDLSATNQGYHNNIPTNDVTVHEDSFMTNQLPDSSLPINHHLTDRMNGGGHAVDLNGNDKTAPTGVEKLALIEHGLADPPEDDADPVLLSEECAARMVNGVVSDDEGSNVVQSDTPNEQTDGLTLKPDEAMVVEFMESDLLEQQMRRAIQEWKEKRQAMENHRKQEEEPRKLLEKQKEEELNRKRHERLKELEEEQTKQQIQKEELESRLAEEAEVTRKRMAETVAAFEAEIAALTEQTETEKASLEAFIEEERKKRLEQEHNAAVILQAGWRGTRVRREHGHVLKERAASRLLEKEAVRVKEIEDERRRLKEEEELKLKMEEEERKKFEEEKRVEEERKQRELEEKKRHEEEVRKRKQEEKKRLEEEKRLEKERKQKEAEEKRQREAEEKRKKEEERKRQEEERKKREEEIRKQKEEEKQRKKEEERRKKEEEKKKKEELKGEKEEERQKQIEEDKRKKLEEEKLKQEEQCKLEEQKKKQEEEAMRVAAGEIESKEQDSLHPYQGREITEDGHPTTPLTDDGVTEASKSIATDEMHTNAQAEMPSVHSSIESQLPVDLSSSTELRSSVDVRASLKSRSSVKFDLPLTETREKLRITWIEKCKPWSNTVSEQKLKKSTPSKKPLRRPASAKKLPPLTDAQILTAANVASLQQVTTVELSDLPGFTLNPLSQSSSLKYLVLRNCHLVAVDGIEGHPTLQYADFRENNIEMVNMSGCKQLVHLDLSRNSLTSIHGLDNCSHLRNLSLAYNRITRISGLDSARRLHTLDLSHNQLITTRGLSNSVMLQHIDVSHNHLPSIDDIEPLGLLQHLNASGNSLMQVPALANQVLLRELVLDDNNLTTLSNLSSSWLPLLNRISVSKNGLTTLHDLGGCISLQKLDISKNQLLDLDVICPSLGRLEFLQHLLIEGNPFTEEPDCIITVKSKIPTLHMIDETSITSPYSRDLTALQEMCKTQLEAQCSLIRSFDRAKNTSKSTGELCKNSIKYFTRSHEVAVEHRYMHEYGDTSPNTQAMPDLTQSVDIEQELEVTPEVKATETTAMKNKFDLALAKASTPHRTSSASSNQSTNNAKNLFNAALSSPQQKIERKMSSATSAAKNMFDATVEKQSHHGMNDSSSHTKRESKDMFEAALERVNHGSEPIAWHSKMASSVKASLVGARLKEQQQLSGGHLSHHLHQAATKIQALWRGYILRQRLQYALEYARFEEEEIADEEFPEIDLDAFDFNMDDLEKGWLPPETPQLPASHPVLGKPPTHPSPENRMPHQQAAVPLFNSRNIPHPPEQPRQAWRNAINSPIADVVPFQPRPPLPPLSRLTDNSDVTLETNRTGRSKKEDKLAEEWGFKDSKTAELMMQRAKKLKYNAAKKKKISQLDPKQRLALFKRLEEGVKLQPVQPPPRKGAPRKDYFVAREESIREHEIVKREEMKLAASRTFEWLHTQVGGHEVTDSRINKNISRVAGTTNGDSNLPQMEPGVLAGGRANMTASPMSIELQSIGSASIYGGESVTSRRHSLADGHGGSQVQLPPIKTGSAPLSHVKERMSFRNKVPATEKSLGWGGGRKRKP